MSRLFTYVVDGTPVNEDPLKIRRLLLEKTDGRAWTYMRHLRTLKDAAVPLGEREASSPPGPDREKLEAEVAINLQATATLEGMLADAAYHAFNIAPVDPTAGSGTTEFEVLEILGKYMEYAEGKG